jgi:hypothetical protein
MTWPRFDDKRPENARDQCMNGQQQANTLKD